MFRRSILLGVAFCIASTTWFGGSATAGTVVFPNEMTSTLVYSSIEETNSSIISGYTLFGGVSTSGENLTFAANNFRVNNQTGGIQMLDGRMSFNVSAKRGYVITGVRISEYGSAQTFNTRSIARATLVGYATPNGGPTLGQQSVYQLNGTPGTVTDERWDLSIAFDFRNTRNVDIDFDNRLFTYATPDVASAYIDKKRIVVQVRTIPHAPEPSSALALLIFGIAGTAVRRRRRV